LYKSNFRLLYTQIKQEELVRKKTFLVCLELFP